MANFRIYNETLCPKLWDSSQHLDPEARLNLLRMAQDFYEKTHLPAPIIDVYLMGSIANYNWTADSDVDVHVIVDYSKLQMPVETANKTVKTAGAQWNLEHEVTVKGHKVEMNIQNSTEQKPYVTGVYSLIKDMWIRKPFRMPVRIDKNVLRFQCESMKKYVQNAIDTGNREQMKATKKYLDAYRQYGLDTYGELSYENIIFKILRSRGLIKKLKDSIVAVYDQEMTVNEVGEKDIKQTLPAFDPVRFDRDYWDKHDRESHEFRLDRLTMDELNALREKARRMGRKDDFVKYDTELKRRMAVINAPITESPLMTKKGKTALAGDKPLRDLPVEDVRGNVVVFREPRENQLIAKGFTLVYFMDSDESAADMKAGKLPYIMVPRGTFHSGGNPITDIWNKKFQRPGTEHILGMIEGMTNENVIYIEMITVRPGWKRNHIAKTMMDVLKKDFPNAKMTTSSRTDDGEKLATGYGIPEDKPEIKEIGSQTRRFDFPSDDDEDNKGAVEVTQFLDSHEQKAYWGLVEKFRRVFNTEFCDEEPVTSSAIVICLGAFNGAHKNEMAKSSQFPEMAALLNVQMSEDRRHGELLHTVLLKLGIKPKELELFYKLDIKASKLYDKWDTKKSGNNESVHEGFGSGIPEKDRLKIKNTDGSTRRWQVRSKDAPKTPKMTDEVVIAVSEFDAPQKVNEIALTPSSKKREHPFSKIEAVVTKLPIFHDPIESKRFFHTQFLEIGKAIKSMSIGIMKKKPSLVMQAMRFIMSAYSRLQPIVEYWITKKADQFPNNRADLERVSDSVEQHITQIKGHTSQIFDNLTKVGDINYATRQLNHMADILHNARVSVDQLIDFDGTPMMEVLKEGLILESPKQERLKKNKKPLTDEERAEVMKRGAVWHHGPNGEETPAVWKSVVDGKAWYCCNTHRAIQIKPTLKGAIKAFEFIKTTA